MSKVIDYIHILRPLHWTKNTFIFAAIIFAHQNMLFRIDKIFLSIVAFVAFSLVSSAVYIFNDICDIEYDRQHPRKRERPIASGRISKVSAGLVGGVILIIGGYIGFKVNALLGLILLGYLVLNLLYSRWLKERVIIDVMCIAGGFVLRAMAGVAAIGVALSPWLVVCTFTLCLFVGFGKRRCELAIMGDDRLAASDTRPVLTRYTTELLAHLLTVSAGVAIVTFLLYTMDPKTTERFGTNFLIYTIPLVIYGIFRFNVLIERGRFSDPMEILFTDKAFQLTIILWVLMCIVIVHWGKGLEYIARTLYKI